ncbi:Hypp3544 [Branchiostoma lanceolatum]|uniref:Hypp3544 protein n=1 Tax=Branchiostoma lanceolatum TaxID=7740 RepID=A0A8K0A2Q9_BRALA|nr:Hypp3544 [Branchiostoma lanceolatum]
MGVLTVIVLGCVALLSSSSSALDSNRKQVVDKLENRLFQILLAAGDKLKEEQQDLSAWGKRGACRWIGTAPFCDPGDCNSDEYLAGSDLYAGGARCWSGIKKKCCGGPRPAHWTEIIG